MIDQLPPLAPDPARCARTLERCHDALNRQRAESRTAARHVAERNTLLAFGVVYLSSLAFAVARVLTS